MDKINPEINVIWFHPERQANKGKGFPTAKSTNVSKSMNNSYCNENRGRKMFLPFTQVKDQNNTQTFNILFSWLGFNHVTFLL